MMKFLNVRLLIAWGLAVLGSLPLIGFLGDFYSTFFGILVLTLIVQLLAAIFFAGLVEKADHIRASQPLDFYLILVLIIGLILFALKMFGMLSQFPHLFDAGVVLLEDGQIAPFLISSVLSLPCIVFGIGCIDRMGFRQSGLNLLVEKNGMGLLLAGAFLAIYFPMATTFNRAIFDVDDIFFDTDGLLWRMRFTTDAVRDYYWRSVHPFVLLLIRPLIAMISVFLKGDRLSAAYVVTALTGALCIFLVWFFVKNISKNSVYAVLIAMLFGASAAQLVFSSLLETYIFLAALALTFMIFLLKDRPFILLVVTGLASFGITLTNFVQMVIAFIFVKRDMKAWVKYGLIVGVLVFPLTLLNNIIYPKSQPYFFVPSSLNAEAENTFAPSARRALAVGRVMIFHSVIAPDPLILKEEIPFLKVWMFKAEPMRMSAYKTAPGKLLALAWFGLCIFGGFLFIKNFKSQDNRFSLAFVTILIFNFLLHLRYGKDLFLYSTNWTYALVLFLAIQWSGLAGRRWFQIVLFVFISFLFMNNFRLIQIMLETASLHVN